MRLRNGFIELTWKEDLVHGPAAMASVPRWKKLLAPAQHWFACTFLGHRPYDAKNHFLDRTIAGTGVPKYDPAEPYAAPYGSYRDVLAAKKKR